MDRLTNYKQICRALLEKISAMTPSDEFTSTQTIIDDERGHYILFDIGWYDSKRVYLPFIHIDVTLEAKVWLQHDGTDLRVADQLAERGIPKNQIVIGFRPPHARALMASLLLNSWPIV